MPPLPSRTLAGPLDRERQRPFSRPPPYQMRLGEGAQIKVDVYQVRTILSDNLPIFLGGIRTCHFCTNWSVTRHSAAHPNPSAARRQSPARIRAAIAGEPTPLVEAPVATASFVAPRVLRAAAPAARGAPPTLTAGASAGPRVPRRSGEHQQRSSSQQR